MNIIDKTVLLHVCTVGFNRCLTCFLFIPKYVTNYVKKTHKALVDAEKRALV